MIKREKCYSNKTSSVKNSIYFYHHGGIPRFYRRNVAINFKEMFRIIKVAKTISHVSACPPQKPVT